MRNTFSGVLVLCVCLVHTGCSDTVEPKVTNNDKKQTEEPDVRFAPVPEGLDYESAVFFCGVDHQEAEAVIRLLKESEIPAMFGDPHLGMIGIGVRATDVERATEIVRKDSKSRSYVMFSSQDDKANRTTD